MITTVLKPFSFAVNLPNKTYTANFEFDKNIVAVKGMIIGTLRPDLMFFRGSQRIEISKIEIYPENFLTQWLMLGINAPMNDRFKQLKDVLIGNRNIKVDYKDADDGRTIFAPYTYHLAFECDLDDTI